MLVLSRKNGESIRVGDNIEITVCQVSGNRVRLAISAPKDVVIRRSELDETKATKQEEALRHDPAAEQEKASLLRRDLPLAMVLTTDFSNVATSR
jgi:carbon storage regulator